VWLLAAPGFYKLYVLICIFATQNKLSLNQLVIQCLTYAVENLDVGGEEGVMGLVGGCVGGEIFGGGKPLPYRV